MKKSLMFTSIFIVILFVTVMVVPVFAAGSLSNVSVTLSKDIPDNLVTFTVPYTASNVDYVSILATKGASENSAPVATVENIVYIKQNSSGSSSFTFKVPYDKFSEETPYCWIKLGGTSLSSSPSAVVVKVYDPLKDLIDSGRSQISVSSRISGCGDDYELQDNQNLTIEGFSLKNATVDTGTGSIIMDGTTITGVVKFDGNGRVYTNANQVLHLMKASSVGFIIAKTIESQSTPQEFTLTANGKDAVVPFDVNGLSGTVIFGITVCNVPVGTTVTLSE